MRARASGLIYRRRESRSKRALPRDATPRALRRAEIRPRIYTYMYVHVYGISSGVRAPVVFLFVQMRAAPPGNSSMEIRRGFFLTGAILHEDCGVLGEFLWWQLLSRIVYWFCSEYSDYFVKNNF